MKRPEITEYKEDYEDYDSLVEETDIVSAMQKQLTEIENLFASIPEEKGEFAYAAGKMTIKELLGHLTVGERVFSYRALRISCGDKTPLPGFDQDLFIANGNFNSISLAELLKEFSNVCRANIIFFQNLSDEAWERTGTVNDNPASVRAIAYNMVNHVRHHINSLRRHYLL
ncbi:MAG: DinB family protein [Pyrinomonadaceae bacterium]